MSGQELCQPSGDRPDQAAPAAGPHPVRVVADLRCRLTVRLTEAAGRTRAAVTGEIDHESAPTVLRVLEDSLRLAPGGLEVDLRGVEFFDCSGLNVLLHLRALAGRLGTGMAVSCMAPPVVRVLELTGTRALFAPDHGDGDGEPV